MVEFFYQCVFVHRDYFFSSASLISLFDDRLELVSVGGLLPGIQLSDIELGVSVLRNRNLAEVFYRLQLIEAYGTGLLKIRESYYGAPVQPKIEVSDNAFKLTLYNSNLVVSENSVGAYFASQRPTSREQLVLNLLQRKDRIRRKDVEIACNVSMSTATILLRTMLQKRMIVKVGQGKHTTYHQHA